jgi:hypothetical protein
MYMWRARDGRYYCQRDNGTTGLIIGAAGGALLGNALTSRYNRTTGTLVDAALARCSAARSTATSCVAGKSTSQSSRPRGVSRATAMLRVTCGTNRTPAKLRVVEVGRNRPTGRRVLLTDESY